MKVPESDNIWYEFQGREFVVVSKVKSIKIKSVYNFVVTTPITKEILLWKDIKLRKIIFQNEILKVTKKLLDEIVLINNKLRESIEIKELIKLYEKAQKTLYI